MIDHLGIKVVRVYKKTRSFPRLKNPNQCLGSPESQLKFDHRVYVTQPNIYFINISVEDQPATQQLPYYAGYPRLLRKFVNQILVAVDLDPDKIIARWSHKALLSSAFVLRPAPNNLEPFPNEPPFDIRAIIKLSNDGQFIMTNNCQISEQAANIFL